MRKHMFKYINSYRWKAKRLIRQMFLSILPRKAIFDYYYKSNKWGSNESLSGDGSTLEETKIIRDEILQVFNKYNIESILDAPCGDFNWVKLLDIPNIDYIGADIVKNLIDKNNKNYKTSNRKFIMLDICMDEFPESDVIMCRDALVHFSNNDVNKFIENIKRSNVKYLLTTTFPDVKNNIDIATGMWRPVNLCLEPFSFPPPEVLINEGFQGKNGRCNDKSLALWEVDKI